MLFNGLLTFNHAFILKSILIKHFLLMLLSLFSHFVGAFIFKLLVFLILWKYLLARRLLFIHFNNDFEANRENHDLVIGSYGFRVST